MSVESSTAKLGPWEAGQIFALMREGFSHREIKDRVVKEDGSPVSLASVGDTVRKLKKNKTWTGQRKEGSGKKRATTEREDAQLEKMVLKRRGEEKVVVKKLKKWVPAFKKLSDALVRQRLRERGLKFLRRRRKTLLTEEQSLARIEWAHWVKRQSAAFLKRWVYADGVVFYLDKTSCQHVQSKRRSLGLHVWRKAETTDALYVDCIAPSAYSKAQGLPVRVWGLLINGELRITVLEHGQVMNRWYYEWIIKHRFVSWLREKKQTQPILVQDGERALWCEEPLAAFKEAGIELMMRHPANSPDLNAIENAWALLRARLDDTFPAERENRNQFITRLRAAVAWINANKADTLLDYARNQKVRAEDVLFQDGGRTQW